MSPFQHKKKQTRFRFICKEIENQLLVEPFPKLVNSDHETLIITLYTEMSEITTKFTRKILEAKIYNCNEIDCNSINNYLNGINEYLEFSS